MPCFMRRALTENHSGLTIRSDPTQTDGRVAMDMIHRRSRGSTRKLTLDADNGFDATESVADLRPACVTPHVAQKVR